MIFRTKRLQSWAPLQFYIFSDGVFIIDAEEPYKKLIGTKVLELNGIPVEKLISDMNSYIHQDNMYTVKWFAPSILRFRSTHEPYGLKQDASSIQLVGKLRSGRTFKELISFVPATNFHGIPKLFPSLLSKASG